MTAETQTEPHTARRPRGVVAFSFAYRGREAEPNPCNVRLAEAVRRSAEAGTVVVAQWEVAKALADAGMQVDHVVEQAANDSYLDSDAVWSAARCVFIERQVHEVVPVAQPFLQSFKVKRLIQKDGFQVAPRRVGWIGFDRSRRNQQWWTRGPVRLILYSILQATIGKRGPLRGTPVAS